MTGEDSAVIRGLVGAALSHFGALSDLFTGASSTLIHPEDTYKSRSHKDQGAR